MFGRLFVHSDPLAVAVDAIPFAPAKSVDKSSQFTVAVSIAFNGFANALLILSAAVMKADGVVKKSELEYVKQFFKQQFPPSYAQQYILRFRDILKSEYNVASECSRINNIMSVDQRLFLIQYLGA